MKTAFLADPIAKQHDTGPGHPESPLRWDAALRGIGENTLADVPVRSATEDELALCHTRPYIQTARRDVASRPTLSTGDTDLCPRSFEVALRAVGTCLNAVDLVMTGEAQNAFTIVRPPGHHASQARGMGFCLFNNIAIAARYARKQFGVDRVAIVDWDVHHGNGTQAMFAADPDLFYGSSHQSPCYPGTGEPWERGVADNIINAPLHARDGSAAFRAAWSNIILPALDKFAPGLLIISAGFDGHVADPLAQLRLETADYSWITTQLVAIAEKHCGNRVVSVLEGGYDLNALAASAAVHVRALMRL